MSDDDDAGSGEAASGGDADRTPSGNADETVPQIDLTLRELSVSVTGRSDDDLETVEESAVGLMSFLVEEMDELEDTPDEYGLS